jgi:anaerobic magnesium-protoporphyrin IX monomethyl ester cyclase
MSLDLIIINPSAAHGIKGGHPIYGDLGNDLIAIEPPLWPRLIAGYVRDRGYSVKIIDAEVTQESPAVVASLVTNEKPRLICIAAYGHMPSASTQQMVGAGETARQIKKRWPESKIIMLGGHVSALPKRTMREEAIDFACVGEGPITILGLLESQLNWKGIPGLVWRNFSCPGIPDQICINKRAPELPLHELHGDAWDLLPMSLYKSHNWQCFGDLSQRQPYASIYTSLNCPFACSFCCISAPFGDRKYRMCEPRNVVHEIISLYMSYNIRTFKIIDEMFVLNPKHYSEIAQGLINSGISDDLNIWAYARVDTVRLDKLALLRNAGIRWLALGIESGSKYVRDGADKRLKNDDIESVVRTIQMAGINVIGNYIFGLPDDTMESMRETLNLALGLNTEFANFYCAMAYPGSPLYDEAVKKSWTLPETWAGYSQHNYECRPLDTQHIPAAQVLKFRDEAFLTYFRNPRYQQMVLEKFGPETLEHVRQMTKYELKRKLLDDTFAPKEKASAQ